MKDAKKIDIDEILRKEWRELAFYYDQDEVKKQWLFYGSKSGLLNFLNCIDEHIEYQKGLSDDSHFGPYSYLKLMTWDKPYIDLNLFAGREEDFKNLKDIYLQKVEITDVNDEFTIDKEYAIDNSASLRIKIMPDDFDPVSMDSKL